MAVPTRERVAPRMRRGARAEAEGMATATLVREADEPDASTVPVRLYSAACCINNVSSASRFYILVRTGPTHNFQSHQPHLRLVLTLLPRHLEPLGEPVDLLVVGPDVILQG